MKILITGAEGFIGSHLVEFFLKKKIKVVATALYNSENSFQWINDLSSKNLEKEIGDIRDPYFCDRIVKKVDKVFNLAALISIPYSYKSVKSYLDTNVSGVINLCESCKNHNKILYQFSTSEVYGTARYSPIDEQHPFQPQSPYSASKIAADAFVKSYINSYNLKANIIRPFNTFGPRQSTRAVIPSIITQLINKNELYLGDLTPIRDFTYVKDLCNFIYQISLLKKFGLTINVGSMEEISIGKLSTMIIEIMKKNVKIKTDNLRTRPVKSEVFKLKADNTYLKSLINYKKNYSLESALKETIGWYTKNLDHFNLKTYNI